MFRFRTVGVIFLLGGVMMSLTACRRPAMVERATANGILLVGNGPEPEGLDPAFTTSTSALQIQQAVFEGLVVPHPEDLSAQPGVAERWEISADGMDWTFDLREDARWSNGAPVTAADFVAGWRRMLTPATGAPNASLFYPIAGAEAFNKGETADFATVGLRAASSRRLEVRLQFPAPYFAGLLAHPAFSPIPEEHVRSLGDLFDRSNPWTRPAHFVGNGPFVLEEWKPHQYLAVKKSPTYWDSGTVGLEGIRFFPIDDLGSEERAFQAGQLHVTEALPPGRLQGWNRHEPSILRIDPYLGTYYILINHRHPPLDEVAVRRALSAVIPREAITGQLLGAGQLPATAFTPPGVAGYTPPQVATEGSDEFGALLAGTELRYLFNSSESHRLIAEALAARWTESLGADIVLENVEARTYFDRRSKADFQLARAVWIGDYVDPMTFLALWRTGGGGSDWSGWSDPEYDAMLDAAERAGTTAERYERLRAAENRLLEEQVMIPLYHYVTVYLLRPEVTGWHPTPLDWHPWKHVGLRAVYNPS